jgi:hypothetical protein
MLTTEEKRKALPCWPRKLREMMSSKSARWVLQTCEDESVRGDSEAWKTGRRRRGRGAEWMWTAYFAAKDLVRVEVDVV